MRRRIRLCGREEEDYENMFNKEELVPKELQDKISLWILRIIFKLNTQYKFLDNRNCFKTNIVTLYLGLEKYVNMDTEEFTRSEIFAKLQAQYTRLEKSKYFTSSKTLTNNITKLSKLIGLNDYEEQILEFAILLDQYDILENATDLAGNRLNSKGAIKAISAILDIPQKAVADAFSSASKFGTTDILQMKYKYKDDISDMLKIIGSDFCDNMLNLDEDILSMFKDIIQPCTKAELTLRDYSHIDKDLEVLMPYLQYSIQSKQKGVNILLYGPAGTGKTELSKTLTKALKTKLFEISYMDKDGEPISDRNRIAAYKTAQALFEKKPTILMYDEAEDIFYSNSGGFFAMPTKQKDKAWINRMLESNPIPTIWITNDIHSIDKAIVRRFDISIEMPIPPQSKRANIIKKYSNNILDTKTIDNLACHPQIAPALISNATKVVRAIKAKNKSKSFTHILNNTLKAQGYRQILSCQDVLPSVYNPKFINTTTNLDELTEGIKKTKNARICLYGPAGTGKSAYGKYIAKVLKRPFIIKKVSDLKGMYVGESEKNIALAFEQAQRDKAVLIFDEVDSFLSSRENARASWEVSEVNEMLVQMENFNGVFIATTNLMDNLDKASLRRFDLKLEFSYLKPQQAWEMFVSYAKDMGLAKPHNSLRALVDTLVHLTPGDFAAVVRQSKFKPLRNARDLIDRLKDEIVTKKVDDGVSKVGFV